MILFANKPSPRLSYIIGFVEKELFDEPIHLTTDKEEFLAFNGVKINYSPERITPEEFYIQPHSLLFEKGIRRQNIQCFETNNSKAFFKTNGDYPFDIFAASFYLLSRYEEYLPYSEDEYGRYAYQNSLAYKENFLHLPIVNIWLKEFKKDLTEKFPSLTIHHSPFTFIPTYDIDEAFCYKHKQWWRTAGGMVKSMVNGQWSMVKERLLVLQGKKNDPYESYEWMNDLHDRYKLRPIYFFHVSPGNGKYDKNILPGRSIMKKLIGKQAERNEIGIHPSWRSNSSPGILKHEILKLTHITGKPIASSRQHYIKFSLPGTYRRLIENGIRKEFSMGYGSINGFRASVASPFYWYDLEKEQSTDLLIYPFCFMDANSFFEQKQTHEQALEEMLRYHNIIRSIDGMMITIWHNTFLGTSQRFRGWKEVYEKFISSIEFPLLSGEG